MEEIILSALSIAVDVEEDQQKIHFLCVFIDKLKILRNKSPKYLRRSFICFEEGVKLLKDVDWSAAKEQSSLTQQPTKKSCLAYFKKAGERAKTAFFNNASLNFEEKITASKIRIASAILQNLDDCELATIDCIASLKELNTEVFAGENLKLAKDLEVGILDSIIYVNLMLASFIHQHTCKRMSVMEWPMIHYGHQLIHPFYHKKIEQMTNASLPWYAIHFQKNDVDFINKKMVVTSEGELLIFDGKKLQKLDNKTKKLQPLCVENFDFENRQVRCMNVVKNGVYLLLDHKDKPNGNYLLALCSECKILQKSSLNFLDDKQFRKFFLVAIPNNKIVMAVVESSKSDVIIYVCNKKGDIIKDFVAKDNHKPIEGEMKCLSVCSNENIAILTYQFPRLYQIIICTLNGECVRKMKVHPNANEIKVYNQVIPTPNSFTGFYFKYDKTMLVIETFSIDTGEFKSKIRLMNAGYDPVMFSSSTRLVHHLNGQVALVSRECMIKICKEHSVHGAMKPTLKWKILEKDSVKSISLPGKTFLTSRLNSRLGYQILIRLLNLITLINSYIF